jgi:hypothetical protein
LTASISSITLDAYWKLNHLNEPHYSLYQDSTKLGAGRAREGGVRAGRSVRENRRSYIKISLLIGLFVAAALSNLLLIDNATSFPHYASAASPPSVWPTQQHDAQRTSFSSNPGAASNSTDWTFGPTNQIKYSPVIGSDGTIYVVDSGFHLYAMNPDGSLKWKKTFNEGLFAPAIGPTGTIYVPGTRHLYAFNPDGSSPWITPYNITTNRNSLIAISQSGIIFEVDTNGSLYAINPFNTAASVIWSLKISCLPATLAIGPSGSIYCGTSNNGTAASLDSVSSNGALQWSFGTHSVVNVPPAIGPDGTLYTVSSGGEIFAIGSSGKQVWALFNIHQEQTSPIIGPNGTIYVAGDILNTPVVISISISGQEGWYENCYPTSGSLCIPFGPIASMTVDNSGTIYVGTNNSGFIALNPGGSLKWAYNRLPSGEGIISPQAISTGGTIYMGTGCLSCNGTGYGHVYAVGRPSGYSPLSVTESGLPATTTWSFLVGGRNYTTTSSSLYFSLPNGNYSWTTPPSASFTTAGVRFGASPAAGSVGIPSSGGVAVSFSSQYQVNFGASPSAGGTINTVSGLWYNPNSVLTTNASVVPGYQFDVWRTDSPGIIIASPSTMSTSITINGPGNVVGVFNPMITISSGADGSVIYLDPPYVGTVAPGQSASFYAPSESIIVLTVKPSAGYSFAGWNSTATGFSYSSPNVDFRVIAPTHLAAVFEIQPVTAITSSIKTTQTSTTSFLSSTTAQPVIVIPSTSKLPTANVALDLAAAVIVGLVVALGVAFLMGIGFLKRSPS